MVRLENNWAEFEKFTMYTSSNSFRRAYSHCECNSIYILFILEKGNEKSRKDVRWHTILLLKVRDVCDIDEKVARRLQFRRPFSAGPHYCIPS